MKSNEHVETIQYASYPTHLDVENIGTPLALACAPIWHVSTLG